MLTYYAMLPANLRAAQATGKSISGESITVNQKINTPLPLPPKSETVASI